jgi:hypothetical protein
MAATERITMTMRELDRFKVIQHVADGRLKPWRAAERLGLTTRQTGRLVARLVDRPGARTLVGAGVLRLRDMEHDLRLRQMNIGRLAPPLGVVGEPPSNVSRLRPLIGDNLATEPRSTQTAADEQDQTGGRRSLSGFRRSQWVCPASSRHSST